MATWRSTTYSEFVGNNSPDRSFAIDNSRVTRELKIDGDAATYRQARADFLGYATVETTLGVPWISRITPHPFPLDPWLYAVAVPRIEGLSYRGSHPMDVAEYAVDRLTLLYSALTYDIREDADLFGFSEITGVADEGLALAAGIESTRYVTKTEEHGSKLLVLNRGSMQIVSEDIGGGVMPLMEGLPLPEAANEVTYTWHAVPAAGVPYVVNTLSIGCVNDATFDRYPAGTLRLDSIKRIPRRDAVGERCYDVQYKMQFLPRVGNTYSETFADPVPAPSARGHNWLFVNTMQGLVLARVTSDGTPMGTPPFRPMDFASLFRPDQS